MDQFGNVTGSFGRRSVQGVKPSLPPWGPHVRFRRVQTLVREGSPLVKLRNSAYGDWRCRFSELSQLAKNQKAQVWRIARGRSAIF